MKVLPFPVSDTRFVVETSEWLASIVVNWWEKLRVEI
jgi:hypothetical protein